AMASSTTWPLTPPRSEIALGSAAAPVKNHSCRRCPPSPSPLPGPALGPAMNPSRDMDMSRTVADTVSPFLARDREASPVAAEAEWFEPCPRYPALRGRGGG